MVLMRARRLILSLVGVVLLGMAFVSVSALALQGHAFSSSFGSAGSGAGEMSLSGAQGVEVAGSGVAVNAVTHDVYVADTGNARIDEFQADGTFIRAWGWGVADGMPAPETCTLICQKGIAGTGPGQFLTPSYVAVDNSSGPSKGDVYVGDTGDQLVTKFSESGALIESWGVQGQLNAAKAPNRRQYPLAGVSVDANGMLAAINLGEQLRKFTQDGSFSEEFEFQREGSARGLAVDSNGNFFMMNREPSVKEITAAGNMIGQVSSSESSTGIAVDSATDDLYVDNGGEIEHYAFTATGVVGEAGGSSCTVEPESFVGCGATDTFGLGNLSEGAGLGIDQSDARVYVADSKTDKIDVFVPASLAEVTTEPASNVQSTGATLNGTVDPGGVATSYQFEYGKSSEGYGSVSPASPASVGSDSSIHTISAELSGLQPDTAYHYRLAAIDSNGANRGHVQTFETSGPPSLREQSVSELARTEATVEAVINPHGLDTHYHVEYGTTAGYGSSTASIDVGAEAGNQQSSVKLTGLQSGTVYHYRIVAENSQGSLVAPDRSFTTVTAAPIEEELPSDVGSSEATISASIGSGDVRTTYIVEYGTSETYGSSTPEASIVASQGATHVIIRLTGLQAITTYHFRIVASNSFGTTEAPDMTFTTLAAQLSSTLPDNRSYELVSADPANQDMYSPETGENFENFEDIASSEPFRAAADGDSVAYLGEPPAENGNGSIGPALGDQFLATRGPAGWEAGAITPSNTDANTRYSYFSSDLSLGVLYSNKPVLPATPPAPAECVYKLYSHTVSDGGFHSLISSVPSSGTCNGTVPVSAGSSANGSHVLFQTEAALTEEASAGAREGEYDLYDSVGGRLHQVNILPDGSAEQSAHASFGSLRQIAFKYEGPERPDLSNVVSSDGSRVFWSSYEVAYPEGQPVYTEKALYVRENDAQPQSPVGPRGECTVSGDACTVQIDAGEAGCVAEGKCGSGSGRFWTASSDGSKVFFTDCAKLTSDSTAKSSGGCQTSESWSHQTGNDLYEYDVETGRLTDLTVDGKPGDVLGADVQGVVGTSQDGSYVYFVAGGALAPGAVHRVCTRAELGGPGEEAERQQEAQGLLPSHHGCNVYVLHGGLTSFVGALLEIDDQLTPISANLETRGDWRGALGERTAQVSSDGRGLAFMSTVRLTGYDSGGVREAFVYDALTGKISCASCNPTGVPTSGNGYGIGNYLSASSQATFMQRFISADGSRVFFETKEALVPQDTNGLQDVYEWERNGAGSCQAAPTGQLERGCVYLLSGGESSDSAYFIDADASGENVFFTSRGKLSSQVRDENVAVYDARVNGGFDVPSLACTGTGCQGVPPAPPIFATPSSVTFDGVGNFPPSSRPAVKPKSKTARCKRGSVKKHGKCVRKKKPQRKTKRSSTRSERGRKR
jgi:hypothetical protein